MTPEAATRMQIERYRQMTGEESLLIALRLHELSCDIAREGIRAQFPNATREEVELKLAERIRIYNRVSNFEERLTAMKSNAYCNQPFLTALGSASTIDT